jgi:RNA polymerase sigma factor for flagellar operon FliA
MASPRALHVLRGRTADLAPEGVIPRPHPADGAATAPPAGPDDEPDDGPDDRLDERPDDPAEPVGAPRLALVPEAPDESGADMALLWEHFATTGSAAARERLILHYAPLVSRVAGRVGMRLPRTVDQGDLVSYGMFGLIDAIEKYSTDRDVKFESYASARIRGAIIDELRSLDWVPRSVRSKARAVDRAHAELESRLHRAPTDEETATHLRLTVRELRVVYSQLATVNVAALDELLGSGESGGSSLGDTLGDDRCVDPAGAVDAAETKYLLARAVEQLAERERIVVVLYYYEGMTLAEIGRVLGVTESRISQMHTAAMLRLRTRLLEAERD